MTENLQATLSKAFRDLPSCYEADALSNCSTVALATFIYYLPQTAIPLSSAGSPLWRSDLVRESIAFYRGLCGSGNFFSASTRASVWGKASGRWKFRALRKRGRLQSAWVSAGNCPRRRLSFRSNLGSAVDAAPLRQ